jgi:hypothetical protein
MTLFPNLLTEVELYVNALGWHVFKCADRLAKMLR